MPYSYFDSVVSDLFAYYDEELTELATFDDPFQYELDLDGIIETIYDEAFIDDSITGNASGSYFCNSYKARECVVENLDMLNELYNEGFVDKETLADMVIDEEWERLDVCLRCLVLHGACAYFVRSQLDSDRENIDPEDYQF